MLNPRIGSASRDSGTISESQVRIADTVGMLRLWILVVLVLGLLGTVTELVLLSHYEQPAQLVPVVLIVLALVVLVWHAIGLYSQCKSNRPERVISHQDMPGWMRSSRNEHLINEASGE